MRVLKTNVLAPVTSRRHLLCLVSLADELPIVPADLMRHPLPPFVSALGNLLPITVTGPSPFSVDPSPHIAVQNVDARQVHQQAFFVNQDQPAEVMEIAELKHRALMAE